MKEIAKRRIEMYRETREITIIKMNIQPRTEFCERCQKSVETFTIGQSALQLNIDLNEVCKRIANENLHLVNAESEIALICAGSNKSGITEVVDLREISSNRRSESGANSKGRELHDHPDLA